MAQPLVSDELWELVEPLIPKVERRFRYPGRKRIDDRKVLTGIVFVLKTGIAWEHLPQGLGCGSGMTCWRRLDEWQQAGVWQRLHELLLAKLREADRIDWSRVVVDSAQVPAVLGAPKTDPSPVNRRKAGSKHHLITDAAGIPLACLVTGANRHDLSQLLGLVRRDSPCARQAGSSQASATLAARRPRLPLKGGRGLAARAQDHTHHRAPACPARLRARPPTLGRRAHTLLGPPTPPAPAPLRTTRRHPRSFRRDRLQPDLPQSPSGIILIDALNHERKAPG
jgi:transposase